MAGVDRLRDRLTARVRAFRSARLPGGEAATGRTARVRACRNARSRRQAGAGMCAFLLALTLAGCGEPPPLADTAPSSEALAAAVLDALADADADRLAALALDDREFREVVWPHLPASRPERGVPASYAWADLHQKSSNALRRLVARRGGRRFTLLAVDHDGETTDYGAFRVHRETRLRVRDETGREIDVRFYGSTLARDGEYKVFSFVVD